MKRNLWIVLAVVALAAMFFVPRAAYSLEIARVSSVRISPISASTIQLPSRPRLLPDLVPTLPTQRIPGQFPGRPTIQLPSMPKIMPAMPSTVRLAPAGRLMAMPKTLSSAAQSEKGVTSASLDAAYDNARVQENDDIVVIEIKKERRPARQMLPEAELELEIGIIQ